MCLYVPTSCLRMNALAAIDYPLKTFSSSSFASRHLIAIVSITWPWHRRRAIPSFLRPAGPLQRAPFELNNECVCIRFSLTANGYQGSALALPRNALLFLPRRNPLQDNCCAITANHCHWNVGVCKHVLGEARVKWRVARSETAAVIEQTNLCNTTVTEAQCKD